VQGKYEKKFISISIGLLHLIWQSEIVYPKNHQSSLTAKKTCLENSIFMRVPRIRASLMHGQQIPVFYFQVIDPQRERPAGGGGVHPKRGSRCADHNY
jgi:hypothetical protein